MPLGARIKEQRKKCGLSQEKVAELAGVSRQAVTKWEAGQSAPSTENLFKLAEIFGTTVDLLLAAEGQEKNTARRAGWKRSLWCTLAVVGSYLAVYLLGRVIWCDFSESSLMGWLFLVRPKGEHSYLYGWLLSSGLFWGALAVSALPAIWGKFKFSLATLAGFVLGLVAGMIFGPNPDGAAIGQSHYGWLIWGVVYLLSVPVGILVERSSKNGGEK